MKFWLIVGILSVLHIGAMEQNDLIRGPDYTDEYGYIQYSEVASVCEWLCNSGQDFRLGKFIVFRTLEININFR
jgi:hypothetical protein